MGQEQLSVKVDIPDQRRANDVPVTSGRAAAGPSGRRLLGRHLSSVGVLRVSDNPGVKRARPQWPCRLPSNRYAPN